VGASSKKPNEKGGNSEKIKEGQIWGEGESSQWARSGCTRASLKMDKKMSCSGSSGPLSVGNRHKRKKRGINAIIDCFGEGKFGRGGQRESYILFRQSSTPEGRVRISVVVIRRRKRTQVSYVRTLPRKKKKGYVGTGKGRRTFRDLRGAKRAEGSNPSWFELAEEKKN